MDFIKDLKNKKSDIYISLMDLKKFNKCDYSTFKQIQKNIKLNNYNLFFYNNTLKNDVMDFTYIFNLFENVNINKISFKNMAVFSLSKEKIKKSTFDNCIIYDYDLENKFNINDDKNIFLIKDLSQTKLFKYPKILILNNLTKKDLYNLTKIRGSLKNVYILYKNKLFLLDKITI